MSGTTATLKRLLPRYRESIGFLLVPGAGNRIETIISMGIPWACDNAAYGFFDCPAYMRMLGKVCTARIKPLWVVCPDKVSDAKETIRLWEIWSPLIWEIGLVPAFVLQDGQENLELPQAQAYFIGGSTEWKLSEIAADLGIEAKRRGASLHMGRVNSFRRLRSARNFGCDTVDGTGVSKWGDANLRTACRWVNRLREQPLYDFTTTALAGKTNAGRELPMLRQADGNLLPAL